MTAYTPPLTDLEFILHDVLGISALPTPGFADLDRETTAAIFEEAGKLARDVLAPLNAVGDREGCRLENGVVRTPEGFKAAYDAVAEGGWIGIDLAEEYGGQGMPHILNTAIGTMHAAANMALNMYWGLSHGAYNAIAAHASDELKARWLPKLVTGEWSGTMNLTEPHCGTDLGLLRTKAEPQADGSYRVTGQKIFISAGEHDLTENIVHLVLARIPGAPEGVKGISLLIVPKFLVTEDGALGERNGVSCGKIEEKMGIHGNATCVMNYDGATGWLVGEPHKGLRAMFTMMNEARLAVGAQGLAQGDAAYQIAAAYARERLQGRAVGKPANPAGPADPLIVHPDVRRALMDQRAFIEGGRAFLLWAASLIDQAQRTGDAGAEGLVSLLTPVVKGFLTDKGFEGAVQAQQLFGGHGYIEETGASQFVRDARIAMIYEGANGVQALDLVGRKLGADGGRHVMAFFEIVKGFIRESAGEEGMAEFVEPLKAASKDLQAAATFFVQKGMKDPNEALAGSTDFLHLFGLVGLGLMWARMARAALGRDDDFGRAKLATARYYMARTLPETGLRLARIQSGAGPVMALPAEAF
ncbi:acyl-CoA dehydrogenase C-terminal domain-containing protein [Amaricoccus sp.]|uniref:acyl-CoA dehydrogenase C-terminal domain-containing protein n=1 Tax=Amaricoccus sp. TaxID=1872485 RepID=UPI001B786F4F|nr:acyl-CoA dehydrogenase C-terminal domain-containing protein [Amaricoccus sp.]MBP7002027.1 acyl-CoA dehydrogenase C-terminal domain-containing protein [Amaricoccus sp.]